jgi:hypothetical protein
MIRKKQVKRKRKKTSIEIMTPEELWARIEQRAYEIYEKRGGIQNNELADWLEAERMVKEELNIDNC